MAQMLCEDSSMVLSPLAVRWDPMVTFVQRERQAELMDITSWQKHKELMGGCCALLFFCLVNWSQCVGIGVTWGAELP